MNKTDILNIHLLCAIQSFILIISGFIMWKFPPKTINSAYGFRTKRTMQSQENWDFANKTVGFLFLLFGFIYSFLTDILVIILLSLPDGNYDKYYFSLSLVPSLIFLLFIASACIITQSLIKQR